MKCKLCNRKGGYFIKTDTNEWCHMSCYVWIPEPYLENDIVKGIDRIDHERYLLNCCVCNKNENIPCIQVYLILYNQCHHPRCYKAYHINCCLLNGLCVKVIESKSGHILRKSYCPKHSILHYPQEILEDVKKSGYLTEDFNCIVKSTKKRKKNDEQIIKPIVVAKAVILFSGINKNEYIKYIKELEKTNNQDIIITGIMSSEVTHILAKSKIVNIKDKNYRLTDRTIKYLYLII